MFAWLLAKLNPLPKQLRIENAEYEFDGGSTTLIGLDERGKKRHIFLPANPLDVDDDADHPRRLSVGFRRLPIGGPEEYTLLVVLEHSLEEIRSRPVADDDGSFPSESEGVMIYGSPDLQELGACETPNERLALMVEWVVNYLRSPESGRTWPQ